MSGHRIRRLTWGAVHAGVILGGAGILALSASTTATAATDVALAPVVHNSGPAPAPPAPAKGKAPSKQPSPVQFVQAVPGQAAGTVVVTWAPPAYNGNWVNRFGVTLPYVITDYDLMGVPAKSWSACNDMSFTCTVVGLKPGKTYNVKVKVWNAKGRHSKATPAVSVVAPG